MTRVKTESDGDGVACPHCGKVQRDLWDYRWGNHETIETECGSCAKPITLTRIVTVDYTAEAEVSDERAADIGADVPDAPGDGPTCGADSPEHWGCTRPPLHLGDHVARALGPEVIARWPQ